MTKGFDNNSGWHGVERRNPYRSDKSGWDGVERRGRKNVQLEQQLLTALEDDIARNRLVMPSLPEVAFKVRDLLADPHCSYAELARLIGSDAALSARVLKVANSAMMRGGKAIEDIKMAVNRLGLQLVRSLVTQLALLQSIHGYDDGLRQPLKTIAEHSMDVAARCHALAATYTRLNPEEAMLAGLVHDIGKLPLLLRLRERLGKQSDGQFEEIVERLHTRVGGMVLRSWNFSPELVAAAEEHAQLQRNPDGEPDLADIVIVANTLHHLQHGTYSDLTIQADNARVFSKLGKTAHQLRENPALTAQTTIAMERFTM